MRQAMPRRQVVRWYRDPVDMHEIHVDGLPPHNLLASRYLFTCSFVWLAALIFGRVEPMGEVPAPHTNTPEAAWYGMGRDFSYGGATHAGFRGGTSVCLRGVYASCSWFLSCSAFQGKT